MKLIKPMRREKYIRVFDKSLYISNTVSEGERYVEFFEDKGKIYFRIFDKKTPNSYYISYWHHVSCSKVARLLGKGKFSVSYIPEKDLWRVEK